MPFIFEKLEVYQKAVDFTDEVAALTEGFPRGYGFLVDQLNFGISARFKNYRIGVTPGGPTGDRQEKMAENGASFESQKRHFSVLGAGVSQHKLLIWRLLCRPTSLAAESNKNVGAPFLGGDRVDVTRRPYTPRRFGSFDLRQTRRCRPDGDLAVARYVPLTRCERISWFAPA